MWNEELGMRSEEWGVRNVKKAEPKFGSAFGGVLLCVVL